MSQDEEDSLTDGKEKAWSFWLEDYIFLQSLCCNTMLGVDLAEIFGGG